MQESRRPMRGPLLRSSSTIQNGATRPRLGRVHAVFISILKNRKKQSATKGYTLRKEGTKARQSVKQAGKSGAQPRQKGTHCDNGAQKQANRANRHENRVRNRDKRVHIANPDKYRTVPPKLRLRERRPALKYALRNAFAYTCVSDFNSGKPGSSRNRLSHRTVRAASTRPPLASEFHRLRRA